MNSTVHGSQIHRGKKSDVHAAAIAESAVRRADAEASQTFSVSVEMIETDENLCWDNRSTYLYR